MGEAAGRGKIPFLLSFFAGFLIVIISVYGFTLLRERRGIPAGIDRASLVQIDDSEILGERDEEFVLARKTVGEPTRFVMRTPDGTLETKTLPAVPYYQGKAFPVLFFAIGLFCYLVGFGTFFLRPSDPKARLFFWMALAFASALIISGEFYCAGPSVWTLVPSIEFILAYVLVPALFLRFFLAFSGTPLRIPAFIVYLPAFVLGTAQVASFLYAFLAPSIEMARFFNAQYYLFRIYIILYLLLGVASLSLSLSLRRTKSPEERAQMRWIFYGLVVGLFPFVFLYELPVALSLKPLLSEDLSTVFFIVLPLAFAVAIVKYKLMVIDIVINRSLVYSLLTVFTAGVYLLFILASQKVFARVLVIQETVLSVIGVFLAAAAFQPAQKRIQEVVDKLFFRQKYDYGRTILAFSEMAQCVFTRDELLRFFETEVQRILPLESLEILPDGGPSGQAEGRWTFPMRLASGASFGVLALGRKKSGERFSPEDIELLQTMAGELTVNLERIKLQEDVIYERASREKSEELNRLKTEFISTVSHELRTPLSSIHGLAELLRTGQVKGRDEREKYLTLMVSESGRLSRFLHNVLDYGRIEQQAKSYEFRRTCLQDVIRESVDVFGALLESRGFRLILRLPERPVELSVDADAVKEALINLIDNAMKYSADRKVLEIGLVERERDVEIYVRDEGIGIPAEEQARIFDKFYRVAEASRMSPKGAGLGLKIVKHIMQAHHGEIAVESEPGRGGTFRLVFPKAGR